MTLSFYEVKTNSSLVYSFKASYFHISNDILHFYDENDEVTWVIKDWVSFFRSTVEEKEPCNPDEFYENLEE